MSDDLSDDGGSRRRMTAGDDAGDDVGNDVGDRDNGVKDAGNNASKGDGRDAGGEGEGGSWRQRRRRQRQWRQRWMHIAGVVCFLL